MQMRLDLHGLNSDKAERALMMKFLDIKESDENEYIEELYIIYGKGTGTLRNVVIDFIEKKGYEYTFANEGAIIVNLSKRL